MALLPMYLTTLLLAVPAILQAFALTKSRESLNLKRDTSLQDSLFPTSETYTAGFTTAEGVQVSGVSSVPLSDSALGVYKVASETTHELVQQGGKNAWQAVYNEGSYSSGGTKGGFSFYVNGTTEFASALSAGAYGVMFGYSVMFEQNFQWNMGGKLPGGCKFVWSPIMIEVSYLTYQK